MDFVRELKKNLWNMKVTMTPIVVDALGTVVPKSLERNLEELEIRGRIETIQTTALLKPVWMLKWVLEIRGDILLIGHQGKTNANAGVKIHFE